LANERVALETEATRALFTDHNIAYLKGDWTLQNPEITEYLGHYQRNGVPLYVLYWPGKETQVLPQILTPALLREVVLNASQ
jgi:thiol:disulfide interchange protein DsbD